MPTTSSVTTARMGELHEEHLAEINGGRKSRSSGNQWHDAADGRNSRDDAFNFAWDGKSTLGKGITITLDMIAKIREQAGGERPEIGLRWYGSGDLTQVAEDWIAVRDVDFEEMKIAATAYEAAKPKIDAALADLERLGAENERLAQGLQAALEKVGELREATERIAADSERAVPGFVPRLPWTVIHLLIAGPDDPINGHVRKVVIHGTRYEADGAQTPFEVREVRVERTPADRPRLIVDNRVVRDGDLYENGLLKNRVWAGNPAGEVG
jgi:hypothetical protein